MQECRVAPLLEAIAPTSLLKMQRPSRKILKPESPRFATCRVLPSIMSAMQAVLVPSTSMVPVCAMCISPRAPWPLLRPQPFSVAAAATSSSRLLAHLTE